MTRAYDTVAMALEEMRRGNSLPDALGIVELQWTLGMAALSLLIPLAGVPGYIRDAFLFSNTANNGYQTARPPPHTLLPLALMRKMTWPMGGSLTTLVPTNLLTLLWWLWSRQQWPARCWTVTWASITSGPKLLIYLVLQPCTFHSSIQANIPVFRCL